MPVDNIELNCPHCHSQIELAADAAETVDEEVLCPSCGNSFNVDPYQTNINNCPVELPNLDKFQLIRVVGRGAFGTVYRARDTQLQRIVAIKLPRTGQFTTEEDEEAFVREARNAAQLQHPGIVSIYDVGRSGAFPYIVSEFVEGFTLADALSAKQFTLRASAQLVAEIAGALHHAHEQGVVHRDLKPSNIMMTPQGRPRVMDFGLAKSESGEATMTVEGQPLGTPAYMSPEQAAGHGHQADGRSDIYSLGVILYELITGELPFRGNQRMLLHQVLNDEPRAPRSLNDRVPRDLETLCLKAMSKEPGRRYQTGQDVVDELNRFLTGQPILARPVGRVERTWRWCRRNPMVSGMAASLVVVIVGAFIAVTSQWLVAQSALKRMVEAQAQRVTAQVEGLLKAAPESLTPVLNNLPQYDEIAPELRRQMSRDGIDDRDRLRLSLGLLRGDPEQLKYVRERMLSVELGELLAVRVALAPHLNKISDDLWSVLNDTKAPADQRFSAALILASGETDESKKADQWQVHAPFLAGRLLESISTDPSSYEPLVAALRPIRKSLWPTLADTFRDRAQAQSLRAFATNILIAYAADQPAELAKLVVEADPWQFLVIRPRLTKAMPDAIGVLLLELEEAPPAKATDAQLEAFARRQATTAVALLQLGVEQRVWPLLVHREDPRARSQLIELFYQLKTDPRLLIARLDKEPDASARRAILLALGSYDSAQLAEGDRKIVIDRCADLYRADGDSGIHAASEWVLRHWGQAEALAGSGSPQASAGQEGAMWYAGPEEHTLSLIDGRASTTIGSPSTEAQRSVAEMPHPVVIGHRFAIGTKEVTIAQFRRFSKATGVKMPSYTSKHSPEDNCPIIMVTWYRAAQYCRWLSEQAGVSEDQMCYPSIEEIEAGSRSKEGVPLKPDYLTRTGFRLPTEAEWEVACRGGSMTSRCYGSSPELLANYGWYESNSNDRAWPCGSLKPNDFGLFDMHGNAYEWCGERWVSYYQQKATAAREADLMVAATSNWVLRGGSFDSAAKVLRSAFRDRLEKPMLGSDEVGFRVARTVGE